MATSLAENDIKAYLTQEQIDAARTIGLATGETVDTVQQHMTAACARVDHDAEGWEVAAAMLTQWAVALACYGIAGRLGTPTDTLKNAKDTAEEELKMLVKGDFPGTRRVAAPPVTTNTSSMNYGSLPDRVGRSGGADA